MRQVRRTQQPVHLPLLPHSRRLIFPEESSFRGSFRGVPSGSRRVQAAAGFSLLELMIVVSIIMILVAATAGPYHRSVVRAKEVALKQELAVMRHAIERYTLDQQAPPQSLDDLVSAGYLSEVPVDPFTRRKDWRLDTQGTPLTSGESSVGITDVHSKSDKVSSDGTPYSSW